MKRMQFIKGWRDLIILVALVQLTFMCPLCLGQNNTGNATAAGNGTVGTNTTDTNVAPTAPAAKKTFACTLKPALTGVTDDKVTKVEVTTKKTVYPTTSSATSQVTSGIDIATGRVTVKDLPSCDGITDGGGCIVTYNGTATVTGTTSACTNDTTVLDKKTFECTLPNGTVIGTADKVDVTTTTTVHDSATQAATPAGSSIDIDGEKINVNGLPSCAGIDGGYTCTVTYKNTANVEQPALEGTPSDCEDVADAATTPTTEASITTAQGNDTTDATSPAATTQTEVSEAPPKTANPTSKAPTKTTKKPPPGDKDKDKGDNTMIIVVVVIVAAIVAIAALLFFIKKKKPALWAKLKGKCSSCKEKKPFNKCFKKKKGLTPSATAVSEVPSSKSGMNATASETARKSTVKSPTRKSTVRSPTRKTTVAEGGDEASPDDHMSNDASSQQGSETASQRSGSVVSDGSGSDKASATGSGGSDKSRGSVSDRGSIVSMT